MITITEVKQTLPAGFELLRHGAEGDAFEMMATLARDWTDGSNRFDKDGEALVAAYDGDLLVGVGGIQHDPLVAEALRMTRFYVRPSYRRQRIGWQIAAVLLERPESAGRTITLHAPHSEAARFWEALGFMRDERDGHTHIRTDEFAHA